MATILGMLNKVKALDTDKVIDDAIEETLPDVEAINRERMLDGVKSDGSIMPNYSIISQEVYGYPDEPIKLRDTGAFHAGITAKRQGDAIVQTSTDSKTEMLVDRYGETIFGTGGSYKKQYQDENLRPAMNKKITESTGLKFGK